MQKFVLLLTVCLLTVQARPQEETCENRQCRGPKFSQSDCCRGHSCLSGKDPNTLVCISFRITRIEPIVARANAYAQWVDEMERKYVGAEYPDYMDNNAGTYAKESIHPEQKIVIPKGSNFNNPVPTYGGYPFQVLQVNKEGNRPENLLNISPEGNMITPPMNNNGILPVRNMHVLQENNVGNRPENRLHISPEGNMVTPPMNNNGILPVRNMHVLQENNMGNRPENRLNTSPEGNMVTPPMNNNGNLPVRNMHVLQENNVGNHPENRLNISPEANLAIPTGNTIPPDGQMNIPARDNMVPHQGGNRDTSPRENIQIRSDGVNIPTKHREMSEIHPRGNIEVPIQANMDMGVPPSQNINSNRNKDSGVIVRHDLQKRSGKGIRDNR